MTATDEPLPKVTSESSLDSQPPVVTSNATSESLGTTTAEPTPSTPLAVHPPSDVPALPPRDDRDNDPASPTSPPADPKVAVLLGMFPDFDVSLLQSVLQSVSGDQERAIDVLLGMSDPEYKSTARPDVTQTELDEEIARRIMMEETEQQRRAWQPNVAPTGAPYQQRSHMGGPPQVANQQGDGMAQFQEQLGKFAETGKKTFNTLFSKVKAKIQEFDNPSGQAQPSGSNHPLPHGDSWNTPAQAQSYYDPNPVHAVEGYDVAGAERPAHGTTMGRGSPPAAPKEVSAVAPTATTPPTNVAPTANVDPSKIGLLPKRPVSLGSSPQPSQSLNDEDVVEYVENPFEEANRR